MNYLKRTVLILVWFSPVPAMAQDKIVMDRPPAMAALFAEGVISTGRSERDFALSPDSSELFYTLQSQPGIFQTILYRKKDKKGNWSAPQVAPFAGRYSDLEPAFTADGKGLFFSSNRPVNGDEIKDFDIWYVEKQDGVWGNPKNIGAPVNTAVDEYYPSVALNGNLYFTAAYKNGIGKEDIYWSAWKEGHYQPPVPLDTAINSATYEFNAFVSPDEQFIIFTSYGRRDDQGGGDLYMSLRDAAGDWLPAKNLTMLNSEKLDYCPFVSFDKRILFFSSQRYAIASHYAAPVSYAGLLHSFSLPGNGGGDIYWVDFAEVLKKYFP